MHVKPISCAKLLITHGLSAVPQILTLEKIYHRGSLKLQWVGFSYCKRSYVHALCPSLGYAIIIMCVEKEQVVLRAVICLYS